MQGASLLRVFALAFGRGILMTIVKKSAQKAAIEPVPKRAITNHRVLNEAYHYSKPCK